MSVQNGQKEGTFQSDSKWDDISRVNSFRVMSDYPLVVVVGKSTALANYKQRQHGYLFGASLVSLFILSFCGLMVNRHEKLLAQRSQLQVVNTTLEKEVRQRQLAQELL